MTAKLVSQTLRELGDPEIAAHSQRFFKTGVGEYGEGDRFLGIRVPLIRKQVKRFPALSLADTCELLQSDWHEERLFALLSLVAAYAKGEEPERRRIYRSYLDHTHRVNNWDLVDCSAPGIVGAWLERRSREPINWLATSSSLWERRIAILATLRFIRSNDFHDTLAIAAKLLEDPEDLIHKACGWMLREVGKRDRGVASRFLDEHGPRMPRTMLRYAIERFPQGERKRLLARTS